MLVGLLPKRFVELLFVLGCSLINIGSKKMCSDNNKTYLVSLSSLSTTIVADKDLFDVLQQQMLLVVE
jgi:hypothetical protein